MGMSHDSGNVFGAKLTRTLCLIMPEEFVKDIEFGCTHLDSIHNKIEKLLKDKKIFGVDLYEVGLGQLVEKYFSELNAGPGAVKNTLIKYPSRKIKPEVFLPAYIYVIILSKSFHLLT